MMKWGQNCFFGKTLCVRFGLFSYENFSQRKRSSASGKRGFHPCFCLPACCNCPVALSEFATLILMIQLCLNWTVSKMQLQQENKVAKSNLLRKCGLLAHTSAAFLKNCCTEKLFICLRLVSYSLFLFHKHQKSGCSVSTGFQKLVEGTSALLFYFFRMLLLTLM